MLPPSCAELFGYRRRPTRVVMAGRLGIGGVNPLRVQSMTTTDTCDVEASIAQAARLAAAGCELVRLLLRHPKAAAPLLLSREGEEPGARLEQLYPALRGNRIYVAGGGPISGPYYSSVLEIYITP